MARSGPPGSVTELVAHVREVYASRITGEATLPTRPGSYSELPTDLDTRLRVGLQQRGMTQLATLVFASDERHARTRAFLAAPERKMIALSSARTAKPSAFAMFPMSRPAK